VTSYFETFIEQMRVTAEESVNWRKSLSGENFLENFQAILKESWTKEVAFDTLPDLEESEEEKQGEPRSRKASSQDGDKLEDLLDKESGLYSVAEEPRPSIKLTQAQQPTKEYTAKIIEKVVKKSAQEIFGHLFFDEVVKDEKIRQKLEQVRARSGQAPREEPGEDAVQSSVKTESGAISFQELKEKFCLDSSHKLARFFCLRPSDENPSPRQTLRHF